MKAWYHGSEAKQLLATWFLIAAFVLYAEDREAASEGKILHVGSLPGYWLERCLLAEGNGLLLGFAANPDKLRPGQNPHPNSPETGRTIHLRAKQGEWHASPAEWVAYRAQALAVFEDTVVTVGLEPTTDLRNEVVLVGRPKGESRILWERRLRTEELVPYSASAVALNAREMMVVVNGPPPGADPVNVKGYLALMVKLANDGGEIWRRKIVSDGAVLVSHVGFEAGEIRITGGSKAQTFEHWSGLNPKLTRTWGFEAVFSPDSGQPKSIGQVVASENAGVRRVLRSPASGASLIGGNFSGMLSDVMPATYNVGKGSTAFLVTSPGNGITRQSVLNPVGEERLADLVMLRGICYGLFLQVESLAQVKEPLRLPARRLRLRGYTLKGELVGERELASSQFGWFRSLTLVPHEAGLVVAFESTARCQVLGKHFASTPETSNYFILLMSSFADGAAKVPAP